MDVVELLVGVEETVAADCVEFLPELAPMNGPTPEPLRAMVAGTTRSEERFGSSNGSVTLVPALVRY